MLRLLFAILLIGPVAGCTHAQLRRNSIAQAQTITDLHQQQVLNNLAMFVYEPNSLPSFALPNTGTNQLLDTAALDTPIGWARFDGLRDGLFGLAGFNFNPRVERAAQQSWGLDPINDPRKLELMRCAYQAAVANCGIVPAAMDCVNCRKRFNKFYTGDPNKPVSVIDDDGTTTPTCLRSRPCWFCVGCPKCVPADCCTYVGEYCGVCVWVPPEGRGDLATLTLTILDYAVNDEATSPLKDVTVYLDKTGLPTKSDDAVAEIKATISSEDPVEALITKPYLSELNQLLSDNDVLPSSIATVEDVECMMPADSQPRVRELLRQIAISGDPDDLLRDIVGRILTRNGFDPDKIQTLADVDDMKLGHDYQRAISLVKKLTAIANVGSPPDDKKAARFHRQDLTPMKLLPAPRSNDLLNTQRQLNRVMIPK